MGRMEIQGHQDGIITTVVITPQHGQMSSLYIALSQHTNIGRMKAQLATKPPLFGRWPREM